VLHEVYRKGEAREMGGYRESLLGRMDRGDALIRAKAVIKARRKDPSPAERSQWLFKNWVEPAWGCAHRTACKLMAQARRRPELTAKHGADLATMTKADLEHEDAKAEAAAAEQPDDADEHDGGLPPSVLKDEQGQTVAKHPPTDNAGNINGLDPAATSGTNGEPGRATTSLDDRAPLDGDGPEASAARRKAAYAAAEGLEPVRDEAASATSGAGASSTSAGNGAPPGPTPTPGSPPPPAPPKPKPAPRPPDQQLSEAAGLVRKGLGLMGEAVLKQERWPRQMLLDDIHAMLDDAERRIPAVRAELRKRTVDPSPPAKPAAATDAPSVDAARKPEGAKAKA